MIDADERNAMVETVRAAITEALAEEGHGNDVDDVLAKLGWLEMLADEPDDAIGIVFGALGATNATATALDDVLASQLGHEPRADLAVLLPAYASWEPPGRVASDELRAQGLATSRATRAKEMLVVCGSAAKPRCVAVSAAKIERQPVGGVDPDAGLQAVRARAELSAAADLDPGAWQSAVALGRRAVSHQIEGAGRAVLDLARSHALERTQFGRPIARFQAVRHRLAEVLIALESLEAALVAAREEASPETAALAKALAGRAVRTSAKHAQQVLAGIGFTVEHDFHRYLKRLLALEGLFGSADTIVLDVGRRLLAERRVPTLIEL